MQWRDVIVVPDVLHEHATRPVHVAGEEVVARLGPAAEWREARVVLQKNCV